MDWNFSTTLIGTVPYGNAKEALDKILDGRVDYPSWPQLPALGYAESMYVQTGSRLPGISIEPENKKISVDITSYDPTDVYTAIITEDIDYFSHPAEYHAGLFELFSRDLSKFKGVKGQVTGPISEGLQILDRSGRSVIYDESYSEIVRKVVNMSAKWQVRELSKLNKNVILYFDEPSLTLMGTPFAAISSEQAVEWLNESFEGVECNKAIHCCGNTDWATVFRTNINILSFDAYAYGHTIAMFPEELSQFMERGGVLSWGIIPSNDKLINAESAEALTSVVIRSIDNLVAKGIDEERIIRQSMITPQCGLGGVETQNADIAIDKLRSVSLALKKEYGVE